MVKELDQSAVEAAERKAIAEGNGDMMTLEEFTSAGPIRSVIEEWGLNQYGKKDVGVLVRLLTASENITRDYRHELKKARWQTRDKAREAVRAIHERMFCGVDITPIIDDIIAQSAGENGALVDLVIQGLTHTSFSTNYNGNRNKHWWSNNDREHPRNPSSPIA